MLDPSPGLNKYETAASVSAMAGGKGWGGGGGEPGEIFSLHDGFVHEGVGIPLKFFEIM